MIHSCIGCMVQNSSTSLCWSISSSLNLREAASLTMFAIEMFGLCLVIVRSCSSLDSRSTLMSSSWIF